MPALFSIEWGERAPIAEHKMWRLLQARVMEVEGYGDSVQCRLTALFLGMQALN